jgi:hypothetical protein
MINLTVKPSLITAIADTNVSLDLVAFFNFVPLYDCLPDLEILSLNHSGMTRTVDLPFRPAVADPAAEDEKSFFKNSVTVPIRHKETDKEWVVKINNSGFHICGAKEQEGALRICDQILQLMIATNNCLVKPTVPCKHKCTLDFIPCHIPLDEFTSHFDDRMEEILTTYKDDHEKQEILDYVKDASQSGIFIPSQTAEVFIESCKLVMINYVYKSRNEEDISSMFPRMEFSKHILRKLPEFRKFKNGKYAIKIKFDYFCNAVHHGGSISMKLRNRDTDKSQTIIIHVIKGSVVHSISNLDDLQSGLEFLHEYFPMITDRLLL